MEMELLQISGLDRRRVLRVTARWCGPTTTERNDVLPSHCIGKYRTYILCGEEDSSCEVRSIIGTETDHGRGECMQMVRRQQPKKKTFKFRGHKSRDARARRGGFCARACCLFSYYFLLQRPRTKRQNFLASPTFAAHQVTRLSPFQQVKTSSHAQVAYASWRYN